MQLDHDAARSQGHGRSHDAMASRKKQIYAAVETWVAVQLVNERGAMDMCACMQHQGCATQTLMAVDISTRRHIGYAIIAKCSASAQAISGAPAAPRAAMPWRLVPVSGAVHTKLTVMMPPCAGRSQPRPLHHIQMLALVQCGRIHVRRDMPLQVAITVSGPPLQSFIEVSCAGMARA